MKSLIKILFLLVSISLGAEEVTKKDDKPQKESNTKLYGFVKVDIGYANNALLSYGLENLVAPVMVKRPVSAGDYDSRWTISPSPTRIGVKHDFTEHANALVEIDFINFNMSQGNVNIRPRLRRALVNYSPDENYGVFAGQTWDIFSPLSAHSFNTICIGLNVGNVGWQREQAGAWLKTGITTLTVAGGTIGKNPNPSPSLGIEQNSTPTAAMQVKVEPTDTIDFYISAITVDMKVRQPLIDTNRDDMYLEWDVQKINDKTNTFVQSYQLGGDGTTRVKSGGTSVGFQGKFLDRLDIKAEVNYGSNFGNLNSLGISSVQNRTYAENLSQSKLGVFTTSNVWLGQIKNLQVPLYYSITEAGAFLSFNYIFNENWQGGLHGSATKIVNDDDLTGANETNLFTSQTNNSSWLSPSISGSVRENMLTGYRISYHPNKKVVFFWQNDFMKTIYKNQERYQGILAHIQSINLDTGAITLREPGFSYLKASGFATAIAVRAGIMYKF